MASVDFSQLSISLPVIPDTSRRMIQDNSSLAKMRQRKNEDFPNFSVFALEYSPSNVSLVAEKVRTILIEPLDVRVGKIKGVLKDNNPEDLSFILNILKFENELFALFEEIQRIQKRQNNLLEKFENSINITNGEEATSLTFKFAPPETPEALAFIFKYLNLISSIPGSIGVLSAVQTNQQELQSFLNHPNPEIRLYADLLLSEIIFRQDAVHLEELGGHFSNFIQQHDFLANSKKATDLFHLVIPGIAGFIFLHFKIFNLVEQRIANNSSLPSPLCRKELFSYALQNDTFEEAQRRIFNHVKESSAQSNLYNFFYDRLISLTPKKKFADFKIKYIFPHKKFAEAFIKKESPFFAPSLPIKIDFLIDDEKSSSSNSQTMNTKNAKKKRGAAKSKSLVKKTQQVHLNVISEDSKVTNKKEHQDERPKTECKKKLDERKGPSIHVPTSSSSTSALHWIHNVVSFNYHSRLTNWFKFKPGKDVLPKGYYEGLSLKELELEKIFHSFSPIVDKLVFDARFSFHELRIVEGTLRHIYHLVAIIEERSGNKIFGVISYALNADKTLCFHRYFSNKSSSHFLNQKLDEIFKSTEISEKDFELSTTESTIEELSLETTVMPTENFVFKYTQIPDSRHGTTISIMELPKSYRNQ